jgi:hypothetical protein
MYRNSSSFNLFICYIRLDYIKGMGINEPCIAVNYDVLCVLFLRLTL